MTNSYTRYPNDLPKDYAYLNIFFAQIMNSDSDLEFRLNLTLPSICLDPSTDVAYVANRLYFNHRKYVPITVEKYLSRRGHRSDFCNSLNSEWFYMLNYFNRKSLKRNKSFRKV